MEFQKNEAKKMPLRKRPILIVDNLNRSFGTGPYIKAMLEYSLSGNQPSKFRNEDELIDRTLPNLTNLYEIYQKGNITQKHTLMRGVFKDNLVWGDGMFRTAFIDPTFNDNILKVKQKGLLFNEQPFKVLGLSPVSTESTEYFEHLQHFCELLEPIIQDLRSKGFI
ncbi:hypothetical protein WAE58_04285 [Pedobacter panaciterrae]|uniref:Uncharacterized protein n=1 Tax=Pedobacter panaciterrae TaxID=363849 RepID=A0ABU8NHB2_9SPHI